MDSSVQPIIQQPRSIAIALRKELRQELKEKEKDGIIPAEQQSSYWVSNLVLVKRNGKLRVCIDLIILSKALQRPRYQMPTLDELLPELANAKMFTTVGQFATNYLLDPIWPFQVVTNADGNYICAPNPPD